MNYIKKVGIGTALLLALYGVTEYNKQAKYNELSARVVLSAIEQYGLAGMKSLPTYNGALEYGLENGSISRKDIDRAEIKNKEFRAEWALKTVAINCMDSPLVDI